MSQTIVRHLGKVHPVEVTVKNAGSPVSGLTPTLEIRRMSDEKYFDFGAVAAPWFIDSGGTKQLTLSESTNVPGLYRYEFDSEAAELVTGDELSFIVQNTGANAFYETEHVVFEDDIPNILAKVMTIYQVETGRWKLDPNANTMTFYDESDSPFLVFDMKDANGLPSTCRIYERVPQ